MSHCHFIQLPLHIFLFWFQTVWFIFVLFDPNIFRGFPQNHTVWWTLTAGTRQRSALSDEEADVASSEYKTRILCLSGWCSRSSKQNGDEFLQWAQPQQLRFSSLKNTLTCNTHTRNKLMNYAPSAAGGLWSVSPDLSVITANRNSV